MENRHPAPRSTARPTLEPLAGWLASMFALGEVVRRDLNLASVVGRTVEHPAAAVKRPSFDRNSQVAFSTFEHQGTEETVAVAGVLGSHALCSPAPPVVNKVTARLDHEFGLTGPVKILRNVVD